MAPDVNILEDNTSVYVWKGGQVCIPYWLADLYRLLNTDIMLLDLAYGFSRYS